MRYSVPPELFITPGGFMYCTVKHIASFIRIRKFEMIFPQALFYKEKSLYIQNTVYQTKTC